MMTASEGPETFNDKYVVLYDFHDLGKHGSPMFSTRDRCIERNWTDTDEATAELSTLLDDLESVGLHTEVRPGFYQSILILVKAPRDVLGNAVYKER